MRKLYVLLVLAVTLCESSSFAMVDLKQVQVQNNDEINLLFDGKIGKEQITTEYLSNIIQINIKNVSVYPAKIAPVSGNNLTKVFAYQYSPRLVRCRLFVRGKADDFKDYVKIQPNGKMISIKFDAHPVAPSKGALNEDIDEKALLETVVKDSTPKPEVSPADVIVKQKVSERKTIENTNALPSMTSIAIKLGAVILLLFPILFILKKLKFSEANQAGKSLGTLNRFIGGGSKNKNGKMIEVLSTYYLDPKKSIRVVRIAGELFALGVSNESINLITELQDGPSNPEQSSSKNILSKSSSDEPIFSEILNSESLSPEAAFSVRSKIRTRLKGLKPL